MKRYEFYLPTIPEQKRIASILDKADALREKRKQALSKLDELLQSVFLDMFGDPVTNPKGWNTVSFEEACDFITGFAFKSKEFLKAGKGIRLCRGANVLPKHLDWGDSVDWPANQIENLITLCQSCHKRAEMAVKMRSGLAGLSYVIGHLAPLFLMCDSRDWGVHIDPKSPMAEGNPTIVLYDHIPAGIGLSRRLYEISDELLTSANSLVSACDCEKGCPSCVGPGGELGYGGKRETLAILELIDS